MSTFFIEFSPLAVNHSFLKANSFAADMERDMHKRLLFVDDEPVLRELYLSLGKTSDTDTKCMLRPAFGST
jgi:hypothetical protein